MNQKRRIARTTSVANDSGKDPRDSAPELAASVHQVLTILTDLRSDAPTPELSERIKFVQWLRRELGEVEALLVRVDSDRGSRLASAPAAG
jgi:hypothetical protein